MHIRRTGANAPHSLLFRSPFIRPATSQLHGSNSEGRRARGVPNMNVHSEVSVAKFVTQPYVCTVTEHPSLRCIRLLHGLLSSQKIYRIFDTFHDNEV